MSHLEEPGQGEAVIDASSFAEQREATFRFDFKAPMTATRLRALLTALSQKYDVDPEYAVMAQQDFRALKEELLGAELTIRNHFATLLVPNDSTGGSARIIASPEVPPGEVTFGVLYAPSPISQDASMRIGDEG